MDSATAGAIVTDVVAYRTVARRGAAEAARTSTGCCSTAAIDVVTFTSPSAVRNFAEIYGAEQTMDLLKNTVVAVDRAGHGGGGAPVWASR